MAQPILDQQRLCFLEMNCVSAFKTPLLKKSDVLKNFRFYICYNKLYAPDVLVLFSIYLENILFKKKFPIDTRVSEVVLNIWHVSVDCIMW